ncbi:hypothetical protein DE146DRAFT_602152 [Phaeosphaeria sp. MPI-PUGE-AT-0046c]|nr:hypothetical protein DE146DRAFT_602152 [Phaeosphaeria sp. MPI-PUGE-AT-0046c]
MLELALYSDDACTELYQLENELTCVANLDDEIKSYQVIFSRVRAADTTGITKRSPGEVQRDIEAMLVESLVDLQGEVDNDILGPPKSYEVALFNGTRPNTTEIAAITPNHPYASATLWALTGGISLASLATGCYGVGNAGDISQTSCILGILGTAVSAITNAYNFYQGAKAAKAHWDNNGFAIGIRSGRGRRGLDGENEMLTLSAEEYTEFILDNAGLSARHIGYTQREENPGLHRPAYQFTGPDSNEYIFNIHGDADGEVGHSISFAKNARIEKRQEPGYDGVHIDSGGLDIQVCQRQNADYYDLPSRAETGYQYFYNDLECLLPSQPELGEGNYVSVDVMDTDGNVALTIGMAPYKPGEPNRSGQRVACDNTQFYFSQTCIA